MSVDREQEQRLRENIAMIREKMARAASLSGRMAKQVKLCAASKMQSAEIVRCSAKMEIDLFGENRVQEMVEKRGEHAYLDKPLHFIGHLQTNKVKQVVGVASVIESVDSLRLVQAVEQQAAKLNLVQDIFLEVNIAGEESKSGVSVEGLDGLALVCAQCPHIRVRGLMAIPPANDTDAENRRRFAALRRLAETLQSRQYPNVQMQELSMGMSNDYENAILEGATIVRVGTAIYGKRAYASP